MADLNTSCNFTDAFPELYDPRHLPNSSGRKMVGMEQMKAVLSGSSIWQLVSSPLPDVPDEKMIQALIDGLSTYFDDDGHKTHPLTRALDATHLFAGMVHPNESEYLTMNEGIITFIGPVRLGDLLAQNPQEHFQTYLAMVELQEQLNKY